MNGLLLQFGASLRLHFRNRMALIYGYLFPTIFLLAYWVLYRYETPPLARHMGELLTVTVLGGACFGLPTTIVSERERGVWRRYRLTPIPTGTLVASTVAARYVLLLVAGLIQLLLAMLIGMPAPGHPVQLWLAFSAVSFAFLGLGLVIATMADNVPAVQALGQCIFLPMLIIGGVAVPLESLPDWAQHVSAFFPGRYAVEAIRATMTGGGLAAARFSLFALALIGAAGCLAGGRLFRWDAQQRFAAIQGKGWVAAALAVWIAVGLAAETRHRTRVASPSSTTGRSDVAPAPAPPVGAPAAQAATSAVTPPDGPPPAQAAPTAPAPSTPTPTRPEGGATRGSTTPPVAVAPPPPSSAGAAPPSPAVPPRVAEAPPAAASPAARPAPTDWHAVTLNDIDAQIQFTRLPPDGGIFTPIASTDEQPDDEVAEPLEILRMRLPDWPPGRVPDIVQRVRNLLYVAAVPDILQMPIERFTPLVVYERLEQDIPAPQLIQALFWVAVHPMDGDDSAAGQLAALGLNYGATDPDEARNRAAFYAVKLLGRLTGKIIPK